MWKFQRFLKVFKKPVVSMGIEQLIPKSRSEVLRGLFDINGVGLEIGPGFSPLLPKSDGHKVQTLDHASKDELVSKYRNAPGVDVSKIEDVDHISHGGSLLNAIDSRGQYDFVIASHVIEHTVDLLEFLTDCDALLKQGGELVLAVPDKRFSFDCLRPFATTGQVLQAHMDGRKMHGLGKVFDELAYNCTREGAIAWSPGADGVLDFFCQLDLAQRRYTELAASQQFVDIHAWQFTPSSFRLLIHDLHAIGVCQLNEVQFVDRQGEFFVVLSRNGAGAGLSRISLMAAANRELHAVRA